MVAMHCAEQEGAHLALTAKFKKFASVRQFANQILHLTEAAVEPNLALLEWDVRDVSIVENRKWKAKLRPELVECHLRPLSFSQHVISRVPDGRQIVHQRP